MISGFLSSKVDKSRDFKTNGNVIFTVFSPGFPPKFQSAVMQEIGFLHKHYRNGPIGAIFQDTDIL